MQPLSPHIVQILTNDHCVALAYRTPAGGVAMTPISTLGLHDPQAGTVSFTSSFGNWKKMLRMRQDDRVALVYHTREHSGLDHPNVVVVQGRASFPDVADGSWASPETTARAERFMPAPPTGRFLKWATREYYDLRVVVTISIERVIVDHADLPAAAASQQPPAKGTAARVKAGKYRSRWKQCRHFLIGYTDADGFPMVHRITPSIDGNDVVFTDASLPEGARRAGFLGHWFQHKLVGQGSVVMTGWLQVDGRGTARYSPHTCSGYALPPKKAMFHLAGGLATKFGHRAAVKKGYVRDDVWVGR
jgi:hypothetical protein